jgi:hypothetical protein
MLIVIPDASVIVQVPLDESKNSVVTGPSYKDCATTEETDSESNSNENMINDFTFILLIILHRNTWHYPKIHLKRFAN